MNIREIPIREAVSLLGAFRFRVIDSEMPFGIFLKPVRFNELVLFPSGGLVFAPRVSLVTQKVMFIHQLLGMVKPGFV